MQKNKHNPQNQKPLEPKELFLEIILYSKMVFFNVLFWKANRLAFQNTITNDIGKPFIFFFKSVVRPKGQPHSSSRALRTR